MPLLRILIVTITLWAGCIVGARAQQDAPSGQPHRPPIYEESGFLSPTRYTSAFFGFSFELPESSDVRTLEQPLQPDQYALLSIVLRNGHRPPTALDIAAIESGGPVGSAEDAVRKWRDELKRTNAGATSARQKTIGGHRFHIGETSSPYELHHNQLVAFEEKGYIVEIAVSSLDPEYQPKLEKALLSMKFFEPEAALEVAGKDGQPYMGPTIPRQVVESWLSNPPADRVNPGQVSGRIYQNPQLGFTFQIPESWTVKPTDYPDPLEDFKAQPGLGREAAQEYRSRVASACQRQLLYAVEKKDSPAAPRVLILGAPMECLPGATFPKSIQDKEGALDLLRVLAQTLSGAGDLRKGGLFMIGDQLCIKLQGVVSAPKSSTDKLITRKEHQIIVTKRGEFLVIWRVVSDGPRQLQAIINSNSIKFTQPSSDVTSPK